MRNILLARYRALAAQIAEIIYIYFRCVSINEIKTIARAGNAKTNGIAIQDIVELKTLVKAVNHSIEAILLESISESDTKLYARTQAISDIMLVLNGLFDGSIAATNISTQEMLARMYQKFLLIAKIDTAYGINVLADLRTELLAIARIGIAKTNNFLAQMIADFITVCCADNAETDDIIAFTQSDFKTLLKAESAKTNPILATSLSKSITVAKALSGIYLEVLMISLSYSILVGCITNKRPEELLLSTLVESNTHLKACTKKVLAIQMDCFSKISTLTRIGTAKTNRFGCCSIAKSITYCAISIEGEEDIWYDPIQTGSNVYIRSAYPLWQEGSNVHLDGGVYYEPEQTGSNVYIRSVDSLKGE